MKSRILLLAVLLLIPFAVFAGGQSEDEPAAASIEPAVEGVVEYFDGDVTVNGIPAEFGMKVPRGAVIKTGADSYCEVVFLNRNIFRIMDSTVAEINLSPEASEISLNEGAFAALFTKLEALTSDEPFRLKTQSAVASIRGTAFFVKVESPDKTYICLCNGELELSDAEGKNKDNYSSGHHTAVYFDKSSGETEVSAAPLLYHNDEDLDALAAHIGERIDWYY